MTSSSYDLLIQDAEVVLPNSVVQADIAIRNGQIQEIRHKILGSAERVIDASGKIVMPGVIDIHVHLNEPGTDWEGFETGTKALAAGGCTIYFDMPLNGVPPTISVEALRAKLTVAKGQSSVDYCLWGGLVPGNLEELEALAECGVIGFKAFLSTPGGPSRVHGFVEIDDVNLLRGMEIIAQSNGILALHAESLPIVSHLTAEALSEGRLSAVDYVRTRPISAEVEAVQRALIYAAQTGCRLHFVHISSAEAVACIQNAKMQGQDVSLETCPHYLTLTDEAMALLGPVAKCAPPLRNSAEQELLWQNLFAGKIDMIASDHSPCPIAMKTKHGDDFFAAWGGIAGAQSSLELMIEEANVKRGMSLPDLTYLLSTAPAKRFGLFPRKGVIQMGSDADLVILHPSDAHTLHAEDLFQRHPHSPYIGRRFSSRVEQTLVRGNIVYDIHQSDPFCAEPVGQWIPNTGNASLRGEPS